MSPLHAFPRLLCYLLATHYRPKESHNFLRDWTNGAFPQGWAKKPVTWVSINDARAHAKWAGKRLPHEWEWQYAAQGTDGRLYPWGNQNDNTRVPRFEQTRRQRPPTDVDAYPQGANRSACWTWWAMFGSGPMSSTTNTIGQPYCEAAATTGRPDLNITFRKPAS